MSTSNPVAPATDRIEKVVHLDAPLARVWRALTDHTQFGEWFGVVLSSPFTPGAAVDGTLTNPKYAHITFTFWVEAIEPQRFFAFRWHPFAIEDGIDYAAEPTTLVTFTLEAEGAGTCLTIVESGFDAIPASRREKAFMMNDRGWTSQAENIRKYVTR